MNYTMDYQGGDAYGSGGGGFNTTGDNNFGGMSQGSTGGGGKRNYDEQTVIPVTARMILASKPLDGDTNQLVLQDDRKLHRVKLVGAIRSVESNSTNVRYQIEDGTGLVDVKQWVDENGCSALQQEMAKVEANQNQLVKIVGKLKSFNDKTELLADSVRILQTGNELAHHFLEVVYSGEKFKNTESIVQPTSPMFNAPNSSGGVGFGGSAGRGGRTPVQAQGGDGGSLKDALFTYVQQNGESNEYGASIQDCIRSHPHASEADIRNAIENLQSEGMLYSTVNEDHFKCAM